MKKKIDIYLQPPYLMGNEKKYINDAIDSNWISPYGDYVLRLENIIKKTTNSKYALLLNSGTSAIHLALKCLNISRFDFCKRKLSKNVSINHGYCIKKGVIPYEFTTTVSKFSE